MTTIAQMFGSAFDVPDAETAAHGAGNYRYQEGPSCSHDPHPYRNPTPQAFPETDAARDAAKLAAFQLAEEWALTTPAELTQALVSALTAFSGNIEIFCIYIRSGWRPSLTALLPISELLDALSTGFAHQV